MRTTEILTLLEAIAMVSIAALRMEMHQEPMSKPPT
jgi:hypothetical protein